MGKELVRFYRTIAREIIVVSRDEAKHWELKNHFGTEHVYEKEVRDYGGSWMMKHKSTLKTLICDVRDSRRVHQILRDENPNVIIIAQALKQVDTCENQPSESIDTNILGVRNILDAIEENASRDKNQIKKVCFVSTDKACNPVNVYGMCKSISERMIAAAAKNAKLDLTYVTTRYGNVLSTTGSIVPLFLKQAHQPEVTAFSVTDPRMTRFMMLLPESVQLIDDALSYGDNGTLWIPKLDSFNVLDLADYFSLKFNKPINIIGIRPGEKIHEVLMSEEEDMRWSEIYGNFVICDSNRLRKVEPKEYSSRDHVVSREELTSRLDQFLEKGEYVKTVLEGSNLGT